MTPKAKAGILANLQKEVKKSQDMEDFDLLPECALCEKEFKLDDIQILHVETFVCNGCIKNNSIEHLADKLSQIIKPTTYQEILDELVEQGVKQ